MNQIQISFQPSNSNELNYLEKLKKRIRKTEKETDSKKKRESRAIQRTLKVVYKYINMYLISETNFLIIMLCFFIIPKPVKTIKATQTKLAAQYPNFYWPIRISEKFSYWTSLERKQKMRKCQTIAPTEYPFLELFLASIKLEDERGYSVLMYEKDPIFLHSRYEGKPHESTNDPNISK